MKAHHFIISLFAIAAVATLPPATADEPTMPPSVPPSAHFLQTPIDHIANFFKGFSAGTVKALSDMPDSVDAIARSAQTLKDSTQTALGDLKDKLVAVDYEELPKQARDYIATYIKEHPYQTAFHIANGIVYFTPAALTSPVLSLLGFTSQGPRAASVASGIMSTFGTGAARGVFATAQSAAMGGYGAGAVNGLTRAGSILAGAAQLWRPAQGKKDHTASTEDGGGQIGSKL
ncbi:hypothetical protein W97_05519 [Coniosporium apollinis CBS 100218]|uniref:Uncharacterized protein n=1 Tax=Coniosporium apollinis (strain CBS 100218) TaxID=1168221 RepID=R7YWY8_CONA1|nr:uncharacterized protein W97_05519 [Coniosporium apollinis CBS 100218]EON66422.1 hypothetical protein W97_05519 [Coniosporium apollinis CBS 100218]